MKERLKELRFQLGLTQQQFCDRLGISRGNLAKWESSDIMPSAATISLICKTFLCSEKWLRTGEGDPFPAQTEGEELAAILASVEAEGDPDKIRFVKAVLETIFDAWPIVKKHMEELKAEEDSRSEKTNN